MRITSEESTSYRIREVEARGVKIESALESIGCPIIELKGRNCKLPSCWIRMAASWQHQGLVDRDRCARDLGRQSPDRKSPICLSLRGMLNRFALQNSLFKVSLKEPHASAESRCHVGDFCVGKKQNLRLLCKTSRIIAASSMDAKGMQKEC